MKNMSDFIIKFRIPIIVLFIGLTVFFGMQLPKTEIDPDMVNNLPPDMESRLNTDKIDEIFGGTEMLMVLIQTDDVLNTETLKRVKKLSKKINRLEGVDKTMSLFDLKNIKSVDGAMIVDPAVKRIPKNDEQREILREEIKGNDMVYESVVSSDFTVTTIIALLKTAGQSDSEMVDQLKAAVAEVPGTETTYIGGLPYIRTLIQGNIQKDMRKLMPVGILIMLVFLFIAFKQLRGVLLPFLVVIMSIIFSMGLLPLIGWKIKIITIILPIMLIAVANDYGIHMIAKYQEDNLPGNSFTPKELAIRMFKSLGKPILLTGLTTMAGMLCLLGHIMIPAQELGILAAIGISYALLASLFFIPAIISFLPKSKPVLTENHSTEPQTVLEKILYHLGSLVSNKPKRVIISAVIISLIVGLGIFSIVVDTDPSGYFEEDHEVVKVNHLIDSHLGGSQNINVVFSGDIKSPEMMQKIDTIERAIGDFDEVGNTTSIARVIRQMSRALNDNGDEFYDKIPETRNGVAQYFELYSMSGDAEDFEKMVDFNYENALLMARINKTSTKLLNTVSQKIDDLVGDDPDVSLVGGFGIVLRDLAKAVVNGQVLSLIMATGIVAVMLMLLFRAFSAGLISAIPLALSMTILFGLMGIFGIELNIATAMLSSIMIGVGIDYTIHFLWRYREERQNGLDYVQAVRHTLATTGRGIVFNALSVIIGFLALMASNFVPVRFFGFLVVVSVFACLIGALVLIPALCIVFKPKFLEPK